MAALNRFSPLPLYAQVAEHVQARILSGLYQAGSSIPSEHSLCDEFNVGRPTVRQATEELVKKGYLERRRGAGTFVRPKLEPIDLFSLGGTIRSFHDQGHLVVTQILDTPKLEKLKNGRQGYGFNRIALVEESPLLLEQFWLDIQVFPGFDKLTLSGRSLSEVVEENYGLKPLAADQTFSAVNLSAEQAQVLKTRARSPALLVERQIHFSVAKDALGVRMLCKQDPRYRFSQTILGKSIGGYSA